MKYGIHLYNKADVEGVVFEKKFENMKAGLE
jgi:hypothetical protein